jgi:hypothetical protein
LAAANREAHEKGCPSCKSSNVSIAWRLIPTGGSLAGMQLKFSCVNLLVFECEDCGVKAHISKDDE